MKYHEVRNFEIVDVTRYTNGTFFLDEKGNTGFLVNGKIEKFVFESQLKGYVKKTDVSKMIDTAFKKVTKDVT